MSVTLNPQILGQAENAHRALLDHILTRMDAAIGYAEWVTIKVTAVSGPAARDEIAARISDALKVDSATTIAALTGAGLLAADDELALTPEGRALHDRVSAAIGEILSDVYGEVSTADLATAGRVLTTVTARVNAALADCPALSEGARP
ncbi:hypothetical protein [Actinomadura sp. 6N118]|uniref:hypothetical protein n=1 Tax=Actinomadura sp. 6N118 TaxID=3375151 RepID=UPI00379141E8